MKTGHKIITFFVTAMCFFIIQTKNTNALSNPLSEATKKFFGQNNIIFLNSGCEANTYTLTTGGTVGLLPGNSVEEKIWNYFVQANIPGFSDNAAAISGVMGNFMQESSMDPFNVTGQYHGLYQTNYEGVLNKIKEADLDKYWGNGGNAPEDAVQQAIQIELDYLTKEYDRFIGANGFENGSFLPNLAIVKSQVPEAYSDLFLVAVEGAFSSSAVGLTGTSNAIEDSGVAEMAQSFWKHSYYQDAEQRRTYARQIYDKYSTASSVTAAATATSPSSTSSSSSGATQSYTTLTSERIAFIEKYHDIAVKLSIAYGLPWETAMIQGVVESSSGTSNYAVQRNNFHGIGAYTTNPDHAYSYPTPEAGWEGYYKNLVETETYRNHGVFSGSTVTDPIAALEAIMIAGYCEDLNGGNCDYFEVLAPIVRDLQQMSKDRGWPSSEELAKQYPEWYTNAEKNSQGAGGNSGTSYSGGSNTSTTTFTWSDGWITNMPGMTKEDVTNSPTLREHPANSYSTSNGKPNKILLHYTEGTTNGFSAYSGNEFPAHFIVDLTKQVGYQNLSINQPSVATAAGDGSTIQIEIVGFGYPEEPYYQAEYDLHNFNDTAWDYLAVLLSAISSETGIPLTTSVGWDVSSVYDDKNRIQTVEEFTNITGIVGHMHSPPVTASGRKGDDHPDPGNIWPMVEAAIARNPSASSLNNSLSTVDPCLPNALDGTASGSSSTNGVTTTTYKGQTIAFPIADAHKEMPNTISDLPCNHSVGCHYGPGVPAGQAAAAFDICLTNSCDNQTVVSMTDGTITRITYERNGVSCNHFRIRSNIDNTVIAYMHLTGESTNFKDGDTIKAGDVIGHISPGVTPCNDNSTPHVHIDKGTDTSATGGPTEENRDSEIVSMMNAAYAALPANEAELKLRQSTVQGAVGTDAKGLTSGQALAIANYYKSNKVDLDNWIVPDNSYGKWNCVSFSAWFVQRFTSIGKTGRAWGNGRDVAKNLAQNYNLASGTTPKPFSVFSVTQGVTYCGNNLCGHTGIVVAVNGNTVTTIEAAFGNVDYTEVKERDISYFTNAEYPESPFVYLDTILNTSELNTFLSSN